jgi:hypothetical protein
MQQSSSGDFETLSELDDSDSKSSPPKISDSHNCDNVQPLPDVKSDPFFSFLPPPEYSSKLVTWPNRRLKKKTKNTSRYTHRYYTKNDYCMVQKLPVSKFP